MGTVLSEWLMSMVVTHIPELSKYPQTWVLALKWGEFPFESP